MKMLPYDLCPSCRQIVSKLISTTILNNNGELSNRHGATSTGDNLRKCSGCEKVFFSIVQDHSEQPDDERDNLEVERVSHFHGSKSRTTKTDEPDPLIMKYYRSTLAIQERFSDSNQCKIVDHIKCDGNDTINSIGDESSGFMGPPAESVAVQESKEKIDFERNSGSYLFETGDYVDLEDDEMEESNSANSIISENYSDQDMTLGKDESFSKSLTDEFIDSESVERSKLSRNNSTTFADETQSSFQPQGETQFNLITVYDDMKSNTDSMSPKKVDLFKEMNPNQMNSQRLSRNSDGKQPGFSKLSIFGTSTNPVYSNDTDEIVSVDEIKSKINNNFTVDESKTTSFICKIDHNCHSVFTTLEGVKKHLFGHFFYLNCTICKRKFPHPSGLDQHRKSWHMKSQRLISEFTTVDKIPTKWSSSTSETENLQLEQETEIGSQQSVSDADEIESYQNETFNESADLCSTFIRTVNITETNNDSNNQIKDERILGKRKRSKAKFENWTETTYCSITGQKVSVDEIIAKIAENYTIDKSKEQPYVCLIKHDCRRTYPTITRVKDHLFSHFYFYNCADCGRKLCSPSNFLHHREACKRKVESHIFSGHKRSRLEEPFSQVERERKIKKFATNSSFSVDGEETSKKELVVTFNQIEEPMAKCVEKNSTISEESQIALESQTITSSSLTKDSVNMDPQSELSIVQTGGNIRCHTKVKSSENVISKYPHNDHYLNRIYRCLYCEYQCKPGRRHSVLTHLNGRRLRGTLVAPSCHLRKSLKPADPITGLYEQLEPILVINSRAISELL